AELAASHPELHLELATHQRAYPELLDWLASRPDPGTRAAVAERRARDGGQVAGTTAGTSKSGWEHAESALDKVDRAGEVVGTIFTVLYGIFLIVVGIAIAIFFFSFGSAAGWIGLLVAAYGVYVALPLPGF